VRITPQEMTQLNIRVVERLIDKEPKFLFTLQKIEIYKELCEYILNKILVTENNKEDLKMLQQLENIKTGGAITHVETIGKYDYLLSCKHIVNSIKYNRPLIPQEVILVEGENACIYEVEYLTKSNNNLENLHEDYYVSSMILAAVKYNSINIINYMMAENILDLSVLSKHNWYLVRNSRGNTLRKFLQLLKDNNQRPNLNMLNVKLHSHCKEFDKESILILKEFGHLEKCNPYLTPIVRDKRYIERVVRDSETYGEYALADFCRDVNLYEICNKSTIFKGISNSIGHTSFGDASKVEDEIFSLNEDELFKYLLNRVNTDRYYDMQSVYLDVKSIPFVLWLKREVFGNV